MSEQAAETFFRYFRFRVDHIEAMGRFPPTDAADVGRSNYRAEQHILLAALIESLAGYRRDARSHGTRVALLLREHGGPWFDRCSWPSIRKKLTRGKDPLPRWAHSFEKRKPFDERTWSCVDDPKTGDLPRGFPATEHLYGRLFFAQRNGWLHGAEYAETDDQLDKPEYVPWTPALDEPFPCTRFRPVFGVKFMTRVFREVLVGYEAKCRASRINPCTGKRY